MSASVNPVFSIQFGCGGILGTFEALLNGFFGNQTPQEKNKTGKKLKYTLSRRKIKNAKRTFRNYVTRYNS
jgi:hypothetical protein